MKKLISLATKYISRQNLIRLSYLFGFIIRPFYKGDNVECPICNGHYKKFLAYGYGEAKDNRLCPKCLSLERHRLMYLYLKNETDFFINNYKVLHIAPEQPFLNRFKKCNNLDYYTADLNSPIADIKLDLMDNNIEDESYDIIICNHVLEHVKDAKYALKEIYRMLRKGGWSILLVPIDASVKTHEDPSVTDPAERERKYGQYDHLRQFGNDYSDYIKAAGFIPIKNDFYFNLPKDKRERMRLIRPGEEFIFGGQKSL